MKLGERINSIRLKLLGTRQVLFLFGILETITWGTRLRAGILNYLLRKYYQSKFRRDWKYCLKPPHFEDNRCFLNLWYVNGNNPWPLGRNPDFLTRGFLNREMMSVGCKILDLCCGDGLFDYLFYSGLANHIDALDVDKSAISIAKKYHRASNITYYLSDCINNDFPNSDYDVVVWDGAIGHFHQKDAEKILIKIKNVIGERGILVGSEVLEPEERKSWDHYMTFCEPSNMRNFLKMVFPHVIVKEIPSIRRRYREVYFRCGNNLERLKGYQWQS